MHRPMNTHHTTKDLSPEELAQIPSATQSTPSKPEGG
jgi:hypothetical protein